MSFLALMDTFFPLGSYSAQERARGDLAQTLSDIKRVGGDAVRYSKRVLTSGERIDLDTMKKVAHQASRVLLGRLGLAPRHFYDTDGHRCEFSKPTLVQLSLKSLELYDAPRYDGPVVLFRSKDNQLEGTHDGRLEWQRVLERELQVVSVPGNHFTLLEPPHCQSLANQLENALLGSAELV